MKRVTLLVMFACVGVRSCGRAGERAGVQACGRVNGRAGGRVCGCAGVRACGRADEWPSSTCRIDSGRRRCRQCAVGSSARSRRRWPPSPSRERWSATGRGHGRSHARLFEGSSSLKTNEYYLCADSQKCKQIRGKLVAQYCWYAVAMHTRCCFINIKRYYEWHTYWLCFVETIAFDIYRVTAMSYRRLGTESNVRRSRSGCHGPGPGRRHAPRCRLRHRNRTRPRVHRTQT